MKSLHRCRLVILLFFLLYAVSPVTYNLTAGPHAAASTLETASRSFSSATLFLLEALYAAIAGSDDHDADLPVNRILIKKTCAVHRGNNNLGFKLVHATKHVSASVDLRSTFTIDGGSVDLILSWSDKSDEYRSLSSGLSPPVLS